MIKMWNDKKMGNNKNNKTVMKIAIINRSKSLLVKNK